MSMTAQSMSVNAIHLRFIPHSHHFQKICYTTCERYKDGARGSKVARKRLKMMDARAAHQPQMAGLPVEAHPPHPYFAAPRRATGLKKRVGGGTSPFHPLFYLGLNHL
ncbi:MAG: hypothetical protein RR739_12150, partial [Clostridia bacterium]